LKARPISMNFARTSALIAAMPHASKLTPASFRIEAFSSTTAPRQM
jgi:hypothetical protein